MISKKIVSLLILMINSKIIQTSLMKIQMSPMILIINQTNNSHLETHKDVKEDVTKLLIKTENLIIKILIQMLMVHLMIDTMKTMRSMMLTMHATQKGMQDQMAAMSEDADAMGEAFDDSMNDDSFYLPPEVFDNPDFKRAMESFFSSLKTERTANKIYRTRDEARADVFDYIERFYNTTRRHSTIGYLSPVEFERRGALA